MRQRIVITLLIALAATSCQKKASGQTVAVVNNEEITAADLNAALTNNSNLASGDTQGGAQQRLAGADQPQAAGAAGPVRWFRQVARISQSGAPCDGRPADQHVRVEAIEHRPAPIGPGDQHVRGGHPEMFANREVWTLNQIIYPLPKDAAVIAKLSAAKTLDEIAGILTASGIQFTRDTRKLDTAAFPHNIYAQVAVVKPGEPFIAPGTDKAVANVITAREPAVQQSGPGSSARIECDAARAGRQDRAGPGEQPPRVCEDRISTRVCAALRRSRAAKISLRRRDWRNIRSRSDNRRHSPR